MLLVDGGVQGGHQAQGVERARPRTGAPPFDFAALELELALAAEPSDGGEPDVPPPATLATVVRIVFRLTIAAVVFSFVITVWPFGKPGPDQLVVTRGGPARAGAERSAAEAPRRSGSVRTVESTDAGPAPVELFTVRERRLPAVDTVALTPTVQQSTTTTTATTTTAPNVWVEPEIGPESEWVDAGNGVRVPDLLLRIRFCESTNDYGAANPASTARGAYQFLTKSWRWYGHADRYGAAQAHLATPAQQDEAALRTFQRDGARPWAASRRCWDSDTIDPRYATAGPPATLPPGTTEPPPSSTTETAPPSTDPSTPTTTPPPPPETTVPDTTATTAPTSSTDPATTEPPPSSATTTG